MDWLAARGRGFAVGSARVPIVPAAILFDLLNGGDKAWGAEPPYRGFARAALDAASEGAFALGTVGAGTGACCAGVKGGLGSASARSATGHWVGALVAVNAVGSPLFNGGPHFRAAPYERGKEFGGLGLPASWADEAAAPPLKTGATRVRPQLASLRPTQPSHLRRPRRLAVMAQDGLGLARFRFTRHSTGLPVFAGDRAQYRSGGPARRSRFGRGRCRRHGPRHWPWGFRGASPALSKCPARLAGPVRVCLKDTIFHAGGQQ